MLIHSEYNMEIIDYKFYLDFKKVEIEQDRAIVNLLESNEITYANNPKHPSAMAGLEHVISLLKVKGDWLITNDYYDDDLTRLLRISSKDELLKNVRKNHDQVKSEIPVFNQKAPSLPNSPTTTNWQLFGYDSSKAVFYANANFNRRGPVPTMIQNLDGWNSSWPSSYKLYNGPGVSDCTNFVSQAVFEGVSYIASDQNYFYPDSAHYNDWWYYKFSNSVDGSYPWVTVGGFYDFLTANYFNYLNWGIGERGPAGYPFNDLCIIQPGDVIFMWYQGAWKHSVIVNQIGANPCNATDVFVDAHTENHITWPLTNYSTYSWYPVKIKGYLVEARLSFMPLVNNSGNTAGLMMSSPYPAPEDTFQPPASLLNPYPSP
jgi:hypothetical protein